MNRVAMLGVQAFAILFCASANCSVIAIAGNISLISPPSSVLVSSGLESDTTAFLFGELTHALLIAGAPVDITTPGVYASDASLTPGAVPAGIFLDSYYYHSNPLGADPTNIRTFSGTMTFDRDILGIAVLDAALAATNFLGAPGTLYPSVAQGLELASPADTVTLSADRRTITIFNRTSAASDDLRIITAAVPEPATLALLGMGLAGLGFSRRRKSN